MARLPLLLVWLLLLPLGAAQAQLRASAPVVLREASLRILGEHGADGTLSGGVEITLAEGFKTYWKNPGDSGVPPQFDFSSSAGAREIAVRFPFPARFDDGGGGIAFGYKKSVIFPFEGKLDAGAKLVLRLDFAVCGTLCIPLSAMLELEPTSPVASTETVAALGAARRAVPVAAGAEGASIRRLAPNLFEASLPYAGAPEALAVFADAPAFFEVGAISPATPGMVRVRLKAQPIPGKTTFGPLSLSYGNAEQSVERRFEVDSLP